MLLNILSVLSAYLLAFAAAAPAENQDLAKRTFSGSELLDSIHNLAYGCNDLSSRIKHHKWSAAGENDDLINAVVGIKNDVDAFVGGCSNYDIAAEPIEGFVQGSARLVASLLDLSLCLAEWVLRVGVPACQHVINHCAKFIFALLNCLLGFSKGPAPGSFFGVLSPIHNCLGVIRGCASWWGIELSA